MYVCHVHVSRTFGKFDQVEQRQQEAFLMMAKIESLLTRPSSRQVAMNYLIQLVLCTRCHLRDSSVIGSFD
jgi:hypothetical protein